MQARMNIQKIPQTELSEFRAVLNATKRLQFALSLYAGTRKAVPLVRKASILWIGNSSQPLAREMVRRGFSFNSVSDTDYALHEVRAGQADLIVLEQESCLKGELAAVKFKSAAPKIPILLLCDPQEPGAAQVFFVNMILTSESSPEVLMRAIESLLPAVHEEKTGT